MVRVSCVYVNSLLYALFIMLVLYAAWLSLLCNLDFSCFKSLYYFPVTLVVLVCCSLPQPLDSRLSLSPLYSPTRTMSSTTRERKSVYRVSSSFRIHTHTPSTRRTAEFVTVKHEYAETVCIRKEMTLR